MPWLLRLASVSPWPARQGSRMPKSRRDPSQPRIDPVDFPRNRRRPKSANDSRQERGTERRRALRALSVIRGIPFGGEATGRPAASRRDDGQQANARVGNGTDGAVDGTVSGSTTVDAGVSRVVGGAPVVGARGTTIKRSSDDAVKSPVSVRRRSGPARPAAGAGCLCHATSARACGQRDPYTRAVVDHARASVVATTAAAKH